METEYAAKILLDPLACANQRFVFDTLSHEQLALVPIVQNVASGYLIHPENKNIFPVHIMPKAKFTLLEYWMRSDVPIGEKKKLVWSSFIAVSRARHYLYASKILHMDYSGSNVLLFEGPNGALVPRLCDFTNIIRNATDADATIDRKHLAAAFLAIFRNSTVMDAKEWLESVQDASAPHVEGLEPLELNIILSTFDCVDDMSVIESKARSIAAATSHARVITKQEFWQDLAGKSTAPPGTIAPELSKQLPPLVHPPARAGHLQRWTDAVGSNLTAPANANPTVFSAWLQPQNGSQLPPPFLSAQDSSDLLSVRLVQLRQSLVVPEHQSWSAEDGERPTRASASLDHDSDRGVRNDTLPRSQTHHAASNTLADEFAALVTGADVDSDHSDGGVDLEQVKESYIAVNSGNGDDNLLRLLVEANTNLDHRFWTQKFESLSPQDALLVFYSVSAIKKLFLHYIEPNTVLLANQTLCVPLEVSPIKIPAGTRSRKAHLITSDGSKQQSRRAQSKIRNSTVLATCLSVALSVLFKCHVKLKIGNAGDRDGPFYNINFLFSVTKTLAESTRAKGKKRKNAQEPQADRDAANTGSLHVTVNAPFFSLLDIAERFSDERNHAKPD